MMQEHTYITTHGVLRHLHPTEGAFYQHAFRVLYQLFIYRSVCNWILRLPSPTLFGQTMKDGKLASLMIEQSPRPPEVVGSLYYTCMKSRCLKKCTCFIAGVGYAKGCKYGGKSDICGRTGDSEGDSDL